MDYRVRDARPADMPGMRALMPRLAAFELPPRRVPEHLWRGDEKILEGWLAGTEPACLVQVAEGADGQVIGMAMTRLRGELLSGEPSAHLEALAVAEPAQGTGIAGALMQAAEAAARARGALTMTLHVFARNARARSLYERLGYDGELMRYIKEL